jgi:hypothetical protein
MVKLFTHMGAGEESGENDEPHFRLAKAPVPTPVDDLALYSYFSID